jgi:MFS family permease
MSKYFTGFRLWAFASCIFSPIIALIVPTHFASMGWLWLLLSPAILLTFLTAVCFAFIFTAPKLADSALRVSRFTRATIVLLTAGFGYLEAWLYHCAVERGCSSRLAVIPGVAILAFASLLLYRFRYEELIRTGPQLLGANRFDRSP